MGTPAYMAPEQARGEVDRVGRRSDVFGLGAILCEVLTGAPPFAGADSAAVLRAAAAGAVELALARLSACPEDPELVALCKRCLAPNPDERPADAAEVAGAVADLRAAASERARRAELDRVKAHTEARALRKRRRVQFALIGALAALVAGAGIGSWVVQKRVAERELAELRRAQQEERGRVAAEAALARLPDLWERALWAQAEDSLGQAERLLGPAGDPDLRARLADARRDTAFISRLDRIRLDMVRRVGGELAVRGVPDAYHAAFAEYGFDLRTGEPADLARRIGASPVRQYLLAALDNWWWLGAGTGAGWDRETEPRLLAVLAAATGQTWRAEIAAVWSDADRLAAVYRSIPADQRVPGLVLAASIGLYSRGADSVWVLEDGLRWHPRDFWLQYMSGILGGKARAEARIGACRVALALRPDTPAVLGNLATALLERGDSEGALSALRHAVRLEPSDAKTHASLAWVLICRGEPDAAAEAAREAIRLEPGSEFGHNHLGCALKLRGDNAAAVACFREAARLDPKLVSTRVNLAGALAGLGAFEEAVACGREAVRLAPGETSVHTALGAVLQLRGELDAAAASFKRALQLDPANTAALVNLGGVYLATGEPLAVGCFKEAIRIDPKCVAAHDQLALAYQSLGQSDPALASVREALRLDPKNASARCNLGLLLAARGDWDGALASYKGVIADDPANVLAHINMGAAWHARGDLVAAEACFRRAIQVDPTRAPAHTFLGNVLHAHGDADGAIACYREVVRLQPTNPNALCHLGHAVGMRGGFKEAVELTRRGHELGSKLRNWSYPSAAWVQLFDRCVALEARLPGVASGRDEPKTPGEKCEFAFVCDRPLVRRYSLAVRLYAKALADDPNPTPVYRYQAAGDAVLAAAGADSELTAFGVEEWGCLTDQALRWMRADLVVFRALRANPTHAAAVRTRLAVWKTDPGLASVRDAAALAAMPEADRKRWNALWAEVDSLIAPPPTAPPPRAK